MYKEEQLLAAIVTGNLERVKQLIASGISVNSLLHSEGCTESATVLGTAAHEGRLDIVEYLLSARALVSYRDPLLRNALHWACIGGHPEVVNTLIAHNADVNCMDRTNVTPIIRAAICGSVAIVEALVKAGADVNQCDRLQSSALHYASFHGHQQVVSVLIKAGSVAHNSTIFGQGTPLANLVFQGDYQNCRLLVASGYSLQEDTWIQNLPRQMESNDDIFSFLLNEYRNASPLLRLCRSAIAACLGGVQLQQKLKQLCLPAPVTSYLLLRDIT